MLRFRIFAGSAPRVFTAVAAALLLAAALAPGHSALAQGGAHLTAVDPTSGKVNDSVTATGEGLGKSAVSAVFLSDDKNDYKATVVNQEDTKIVFKVPQVKAGDYNVTIQVGNSLLIQPVRFSVQE